MRAPRLPRGRADRSRRCQHSGQRAALPTPAPGVQLCRWRRARGGRAEERGLVAAAAARSVAPAPRRHHRPAGRTAQPLGACMQTRNGADQRVQCGQRACRYRAAGGGLSEQRESSRPPPQPSRSAVPSRHPPGAPAAGSAVGRPSAATRRVAAAQARGHGLPPGEESRARTRRSSHPQLREAAPAQKRSGYRRDGRGHGREDGRTRGQPRWAAQTVSRPGLQLRPLRAATRPRTLRAPHSRGGALAGPAATLVCVWPSSQAGGRGGAQANLIRG